MMMGLDLILLGVIGYVAYNLGFRPQFNQSGPTKTSQAPLDILKERYARGEITHTEYEQVRRDLEG